MELLVEAFTQKSVWNREQFLQSRPEGDAPLALLCLSRFVEPVASPVSDKVIVLDPEQYAAEATSRLRQTYPDFTMRVSRETGLIDLYIWQGQISWWWFLSFSERSSLRTPLIELLYWFCILEIVLERHGIATIHLATDDVVYGRVLRALCQKHHVSLGEFYSPPQKSFNGFKLILTFLDRFLRVSIMRWLRWLALKRLRLDSVVDYEKIGPESAIFCTFYPAFFEQKGDSDLLDEKLFGTWPDYLRQKGYSIVFAANIALTPRKIVDTAKMLRQHIARHNIVILESLWSLSDLLRITLNFTSLWRYWQWRQRQTGTRMQFHGVDVGSLVLRELDQDVFVKQTMPHSIGLSYAIRRLIEKLGGASCVNHTFEYQPRERAISVGVRMAKRSIPVIGFQISIFTFNHLAWFFPKEEGQQPQADLYDVRLAPLPNYVVAYGQTAYDVFRQRFQPDTVILAGPIRYTQLGRDRSTEIDTDVFRQAHNIPSKSTLFLLAASYIRDETLLMMQMMLKVVADLPNAYLMVKFHPHHSWRQELVEMAKEVDFANYQVFDSNLNTLIKASKAVISASSSVGIEAIVMGCMPIAFYRPGNYELNRLRDFPKAAFFCQNEAELKAALEECLNEGKLYQQCKAHWPRVVKDLLYRLDGRENERLYEELKNRGVF